MRKLIILKSLVDFVWIVTCIPMLLLMAFFTIYMFVNPDALDVFRNFGIPVEKKIEAVQNLLSTRVLPLTVDLVTLTISQGYADNLHDIESNVANFIANKRGASVAKVVTAIELDNKTQKALQKAIKNKVGTDVELSIDVDPSVIGGISISVGERTFDGLLSSKFSEIKTVLEGR